MGNFLPNLAATFGGLGMGNTHNGGYTRDMIDRCKRYKY